MNTQERILIDNGWEEVGIGFYIHDTIKDKFFVDFNGCDEDDDCYIVQKDGCSEVYDVLFHYDDLVNKYCN